MDIFKMYPRKFIIVFFLAFWMFISTILSDDGPAKGNYNDVTSLTPPVATGDDGGKYNDGTSPATGGCGNCNICPYTCHTPPPPPSPPSSSGYPLYGPPPSPPTGQVSNCPPAGSVQCCQYNSPPTPFYTPYYNGSSSSAAAQQNIAISTWCLAVFYVVVSVIFSFDLLQF